jgi:FtsP/CotA-like multicopper oxidase with cupredoxin domain
MKKLIYISIFICQAFGASGQIDYTKLIVGRNQGTHYFHDGDSTRIFGFASTLSENTKIPGPTIEVNSGDSVKIDFWNVSQGAPHTIHLHGLDVDQQNDGVPMLSFEVEHMAHGYYYFKAPHPGTYLYHCHVGSTIHLQAGMYGLLIVRPSDGSLTMNWDNGESYNREFSLLASEIDTVWHNDTVLDHEHDPMIPTLVPESFKAQYFLVNGKSGNQLDAPDNYMYFQSNEKVYMRLANIGYYGVRYIFETGLNARTVASDGRPLPMEMFSDTVEIMPGERYETFLQFGTLTSSVLTVEHFNLNTLETESSQEMIFWSSNASLDETELLTIFPNPTDDIIYFSEEPVLYSISDLAGKEVQFGIDGKADLSNSPSGVYFLRTGDRTYKFIKL